MMRKNIFHSFITVLLLSACTGTEMKKTKTADRIFTDEVLIKTTPVKNQGQSTLCWVFGMLATIESEQLMKGDSLELSTDFYARMFLQDKAREYFFNKQKGNISMRGMSSMLLNMFHKYGALPYNSLYNEHPTHYNVLARRVMQMVKTAPSLEKMNGRMDELLDQNIGFMPRYVFMLGMEYTPRQFAESICLPGEYLSLTSFTHHAFDKKFVLEVPDNQMRDSFMNIRIDTLMHRVERAIRKGHPVCWEGDISEPGFNPIEGWAVVMHKQPTFLDKRKEITQADRQRSFERMETTDDHVMELCGIAHDKDGRKFFRAKNSWGVIGRYKGYMYLSYDYVKLKTIAFYMTKSAWQGR